MSIYTPSSWFQCILNWLDSTSSWAWYRNETKKKSVRLSTEKVNRNSVDFFVRRTGWIIFYEHDAASEWNIWIRRKKIKRITKIETFIRWMSWKSGKNGTLRITKQWLCNDQPYILGHEAVSGQKFYQSHLLPFLNIAYIIQA